LAYLPLCTPWQAPNQYSGMHLYPIVLKLEQISKTRRVIFDLLRAKGIGVNVHYIPVHTQPYYQEMGFEPMDFPNSMDYYQRAITLPLYYGLTPSDQRFVIESLYEVILHKK